MTLFTNINSAIMAIKNNAGIGITEFGAPDILEGHVALLKCTITDYEIDDSEESSKTYNYSRVALIYPGMKGSLSILASDDDGNVFLTDMPDLNMQVDADLEDYKDAFNKHCSTLTDGTALIDCIKEFKV